MTRSETLPDTPRHPGATDGTSARFDHLERQFAVLFDSYRQRLRERSAEFEPGLAPSGYRTLLELVVSGPTGAGTLAESLGFDKSVLSRQLHQLEELGLVSRDQDPSDRRSVIIHATADAVARMERIRTDERDEFRSVLAAWPEGDLDELARLLGNLQRR